MVQKKFLFKLCHFWYQHLEENSYRHLECTFDNPGENSVATNPNFLCSPSKKNENLKNFQNLIFIFKMILWRHRVQFSILISLSKNFSPSTVNVRSKFWRIWKKEYFQKFDFFDWSYETKTATFNFHIPAENFFAKHGICSFKILKKLRKREFSKIWFFVWSYETKTAIFIFDIRAEKVFATHGKCSFKVLKNLKKK